MIIVAWSPSGSLTSLFYADVFRSVLSIFMTYAFLNLLQGTGVILNIRVCVNNSLWWEVLVFHYI